MHFRRRGFRATSLNDLARELGIEKPSLYAAFGNKEQFISQSVGALCCWARTARDRGAGEGADREGGRRCFAFGVCRAAFRSEGTGWLFDCELRRGMSRVERSDPPSSCDVTRHMEVALAKRLKRAQKERELPALKIPGLLACYSLRSFRKGWCRFLGREARPEKLTADCYIALKHSAAS